MGRGGSFRIFLHQNKVSKGENLNDTDEMGKLVEDTEKVKIGIYKLCRKIILVHKEKKLGVFLLYGLCFLCEIRV